MLVNFRSCGENSIRCYLLNLSFEQIKSVSHAALLKIPYCWPVQRLSCLAAFRQTSLRGMYTHFIDNFSDFLQEVLERVC